MNDKKLFLKTDEAGFALYGVLLVTLAGFAANADGIRVGIDIAAPPIPVVVVAPPVVVTPPVVVVQDNYVYYPGYDVYYNSTRHQYAYMDGGLWVSRPAPIGVSVDVLLASPSVKMDFHDSPANHHSEMVRQYPRNWAPSHGTEGRKEIRTEDRGEKHEERRDNDKR
jgi:hypothetical protein